MHGAVGFDVCVCWYEVLQTRFCKDADIGREMVLQTEAEGGGQLARDMDGGLVAGSKLSFDIVV